MGSRSAGGRAALPWALFPWHSSEGLFHKNKRNNLWAAETEAETAVPALSPCYYSSFQLTISSDVFIFESSMRFPSLLGWVYGFPPVHNVILEEKWMFLVYYCVLKLWIITEWGKYLTRGFFFIRQDTTLLIGQLICFAFKLLCK